MKTVLLNPHDYLGLRGRKLRKVFVGTLLIGSLSLGLWHKSEQISFGEQRYTSYVNHSRHTRPEILTVTTFFTSGTSFSRDSSLPGWNGSGGWVDCIGGGASGAASAGGGGGGGGGGWSRYGGMTLGATVSYVVGAGGTGGAGGNTAFNGGTVFAPGGAAASGTSGGGYSGAGNGNVQNLQGGPGGSGTGGVSGGGGGGGAAGPSGGGGIGASASGTSGGQGGVGGAGAGGAGGAGNSGSGGSNGGGGNEYGGGGGSGGGGGGAWYITGGYVGGSYGGGGGGGGWDGSAARPQGNGYQGIIACLYTPVAVPVVSSCSPSNGSTVGGTAVTITGSGFVAPLNSVTFDGVPATSVVLVNSATITCVTPAHVVGAVSVGVNISNGIATGVRANAFSYVSAGGFNMPMLGI